MEKLIKLIWDFRGAESAITAERHLEHLKEYIDIKKLSIDIVGSEKINEFHSTTFIVVDNEEMILLRDSLKPHRGELYEE